ncbi:MAG: hypothetical protein ACREOU_08620, partial [Candidatus Eiseniibacteriota bacterium]
MTDLENRTRRQPGFDDPALDQRVRISRQEDAHRVAREELDEQDDRFPVRGPRRIRAEVRRRPERAHLVLRAARDHLAHRQRAGPWSTGRPAARARSCEHLFGDVAGP